MYINDKVFVDETINRQLRWVCWLVCGSVCKVSFPSTM